MRIAMIGTGYVGLVSGACFSEFGVDVVCVDKDADKIARLNEGQLPIFEPGLEDIVESNENSGRLSFTTDLVAAVDGADAVFIAVGTPSPPRRRPRRSVLCLCRRYRNRPGHERLYGGRHQVDGARRHRR